MTRRGLIASLLAAPAVAVLPDIRRPSLRELHIYHRYMSMVVSILATSARITNAMGRADIPAANDAAIRGYDELRRIALAPASSFADDDVHDGPQS